MRINKHLLLSTAALSMTGGAIIAPMMESDKAEALSTYSQTDFINKLSTSVKTISQEYGIYGSVQMAQAAIESAWGQSDLAVEANNLFGIKGSYNGQSVTMETAEYDEDGNLYYTDANFRSYSSVDQSLTDNAELIRNGTSFDSSYYAGSWVENADSYQAAAENLTGKYATDPEYGTKLINIIEAYDLTRLDEVSFNATAPAEANNGYDDIQYQYGVDYYAYIDQSSRNDGLYKDIYYTTEASSVGNQDALFSNGSFVYIDQEAVTQKATWAHINIDGQWYWIDKAGLNFENPLDEIIGQESVNYKATISEGQDWDGLFINGPHNTEGAQWSNQSNTIAGEQVTVKKEATTSNGVKWALVNYDGNQYWLDTKLLSDVESEYDRVISASNVSYDAQIVQSGDNDGLYYLPYMTDEKSVVPLGSTADFDGRSIHVNQEVVTEKGTWVRVTDIGSEQSFWMAKDSILVK